MTIAICAEDLSVGYKNQAVVSAFCGHIEQGQFVGVFGANGAGKTTLLQCALGLLKPVAGRLLVLGKVPRVGNRNIGYVPQVLPAINVPITGRSFLLAILQGNQWGLPIVRAKHRQEVDRVVELVGSEHYINRPFMQLSGGEKRRLLLAQALLNKPKILLLDEPLANLDPHYQYVLIDLLKRIHRELGITVLLTAHDVNPLLEVMTQVLYLARGNAAMGRVEEVITSQALSSLYGSPIEVIRLKGRILVIHSATGQHEDAACHH